MIPLGPSGMKDSARFFLLPSRSFAASRARSFISSLGLGANARRLVDASSYRPRTDSGERRTRYFGMGYARRGSVLFNQLI